MNTYSGPDPLQGNTEAIQSTKVIGEVIGDRWAIIYHVHRLLICGKMVMVKEKSFPSAVKLRGCCAKWKCWGYITPVGNYSKETVPLSV